MDKTWAMRDYHEGDEEGIFELLKAVYPEREHDYGRWLRWWRWMYKDNPAGPGRIGIAEHNNKIVGHYAIVPLRLSIMGKTVLASQALDGLTHPDYRRTKIFETLVRKVHADGARDGIRIVYGFPNQFSRAGLVGKLDWFDIANMQLMLKVINWKDAIGLLAKNQYLGSIFSPIASLLCDKTLLRRKRPNVAEGLTVKEVTSFDERLDILWSKVANQFHIMVLRDDAYLRWRYGAPETNYSIFIAEKDSEVLGYLVLKYMNMTDNGIKVGIIFDMVAQSKDVLDPLIRKLISACQQNKVALIQYQLRVNKVYRRVLKRNGFISLPFSKGSHFCAYSTRTDIAQQFLRNPDNWFVQIGDSDLV